MTNFNALSAADLATISNTYKTHGKRLYFAAYKICRDFPEPADAARDCVADAFVKACQGAWRGEASLYTFLFKTTCHLALNHIKAAEQSKRIRGASGENVAPCADGDPEGRASVSESNWQPSDVTPKGDCGPERHYLRKETRELINEALKGLCSNREQAVFACCRFDGMTTAACGDTLGIPQATAWRALSSATDKVAGYVQAMTA
jgi:RNA polymerase sigma factor (sigma-70 family)